MQRNNGFYYNGFTGRKLVGITIDKYGNFRFIVENNDHTFQNLLESRDVENLAIWFEIIHASAKDFVDRGACKGSHRLDFKKNISFNLEMNCSHPASDKFKLMFNVCYPGGSLLFNLSKESDFKNIKTVSTDLFQALELISRGKGSCHLTSKLPSDTLLELDLDLDLIFDSVDEI